jgi:hypothetical protein
MGFLVHVFFAWRIQVLTRSRILTGIIGGFALMAVGQYLLLMVQISFTNVPAAGALSASLVALLAKDPRTIEHSLKPVASIWLLASVLADLAITLCLTYHFRKVRQETQELNHILNHILRCAFILCSTATYALILKQQRSKTVSSPQLSP